MRATMRIVVLLVLVLLILVTAAIGIIALLLLPSRLISPQSLGPGGIMLGQWQFFAWLQSQDFINVVLIYLLLLGGGLALLVWQLRTFQRRQPAPAGYVVRHDELGQVRVARKSMSDLVHYEASSVPGVMEVRSEEIRHHPKGRGMRISTQVLLTPGVDAKQVKRELQEKIQTAIQSHFSVSVTGVQIATRIARLHNRRGAGHAN
ncbi:MAG TPA: hypothetical protein VFU32_04805 [Ktedonobacterales bacterium]|nr:hypothetical protein [Ktedonobacterales bacterium]